ncbi:MAG: PA2779 family protein [Acidobacteria bacterium]|nr:PA2779 family protein [Acidobacteriota bacterium]MDW7983817.1 PA2779 family protein [Acidobacteriota bacterium]
MRGTWRVVALGMVALCLWVIGGVGVAVADLVGPHPANPMQTWAERNARLSHWERQLVAQWLRDYGYAPEQVEQWMARVTDADVHAAVLQAENLGLPYGGDDLEAIALILIIIILIIIILRLLDKEIIIR